MCPVFDLIVCALLNVSLRISRFKPTPLYLPAPSVLAFSPSASHYSYPPECGITPLHASRKTTSCSSWSAARHCQAWQWPKPALPLTLFSSRKLERRVKTACERSDCYPSQDAGPRPQALCFLLEDSGRWGYRQPMNELGWAGRLVVHCKRVN